MTDKIIKIKHLFRVCVYRKTGQQQVFPFPSVLNFTSLPGSISKKQLLLQNHMGVAIAR